MQSVLPKDLPAGVNLSPCCFVNWVAPFPREITGDLRSCEGKLKNLGISAPSHSTLAYANETRPWELYEHALLKLFNRCRIQVKIGNSV
jgi:hypothetical protein